MMVGRMKGVEWERGRGEGDEEVSNYGGRERRGEEGKGEGRRRGEEEERGRDERGERRGERRRGGRGGEGMMVELRKGMEWGRGRGVG